MIDLIREYALTPAPCGSEKEIGNLISGKLSSLDIRIDAHGSIIAHKKGIGDGIVFLTSMDTPCMYITHADSDGYLRFSTVGDFKPQKGMPVLLQNGSHGIIGADKEKEDSFFIDTGKDIGSDISEYAVPYPIFNTSKECAFGFSIGKYALISVLTKLALSKTEKDVYFVFATKTSNRQMSSAFMKGVNASLLVSLEISEANDIPSERDIFIKQGKGAVLRLKDGSMISNPSAVQIIEDISPSLQREVTENPGIGGFVQKAFGGIQSVGIGLPVRSYGWCDSVSLNDVDSVLELLIKLI